MFLICIKFCDEPFVGKNENSIKNIEREISYRTKECSNVFCQGDQSKHIHDINDNSIFYKTPKTLISTELSSLILIPFRVLNPSNLNFCFDHRYISTKLVHDLKLFFFKGFEG